MRGEEEACTKCTRKCVLIHRKNSAPCQKVSSFFKVMFGKRFSEVLYLPPKFSHMLRSYVHKGMYLKDSGGAKWRVLLSNENGSLALRNGWSEFSMDHGIEVGDFVVFHYVMGSGCFVVQIFGRSGCEKLAFSAEKGYQNKRLKTSEDALILRLPYPASCSKSLIKKNQGACGVSRSNNDTIPRQDEGENKVKKSPPKSGNAPNDKMIAFRREPTMDFFDDLHFMLDRDMGSAKGDKEDLFDLSIFEMLETKMDVKEVETAAAVVDAKEFRIGEAKTISTENEESWKGCSSLPGSCPGTDMPPSSSMTKNAAERPHKSEFIAPSGSWDLKMMSSAPNIEGYSGSWVEGCLRDSDNPVPGPSPTLTQIPLPIAQSSEMAEGARNVKLEGREVTEDLNANANEVAQTCLDITFEKAKVSVTNVEMDKFVKSELVDFSDSPLVHVANVTCSVEADGETYLELPEPLPIKACRAAKMVKKIVLLRDPIGRLWPVLYHQKYGFKVLTSGWATFRKANNIQQGYECTFTIENREEGILSVTIHRR